jgi:2-dehydro-3-deoxyphosphogluconate aldolase / (4S)-4-hydroxy-2-oxoglutarate aldolase
VSFAATLRSARIVAILRRPDIHEVVLDLCDDLHASGVRAMEVTLDQPTSLDALGRLAAHAPSDMRIGAGTVMTPEDLDAASEAGATFVVCPHLDLELVRRAATRHVDILPGVTSSTEVATALAAGVATLKLFPAGPLGPDYLRAMRGPFPQAAFVPTGGIRSEHVAGWLEAGAAAVGLGSDLFGPGGIHPAIRDLLEQAT